MIRWLKRELAKAGSPSLDWVQVEVTTFCNAACIYCPLGEGARGRQRRHMSLELFRELLPFLRNTDLVFLQVWGEPLLNRDLFEMIRLCRDQGNRVGFTTNGRLLSEKTLQKLVDIELDILGVSLAGTTAPTHNRIRKGTDFDRLVSDLQRLQEIKRDMKSAVPEVHLAYLVLKSNFQELEGLLPLAGKVGAEEIVVSNLSLVVSPELAHEALFNDGEHLDRYREILKGIRAEAELRNIRFAGNDPGLDDSSLSCGENIGRSCVISVEGDVCPCVLTDPVLGSGTGPQGTESPTYLFKGETCPLAGLTFGNIARESLTRIWNKAEYRDLRRFFDPDNQLDPGRILSQIPRCCRKCNKRLLG